MAGAAAVALQARRAHRAYYAERMVGVNGQRARSFEMERNRRLRNLNLGFADLESDPELANDFMRDFPELAQELLHEQQQANAPIAAISHSQISRNEPAPTIHSELLVASSVLVNPSTPRSSAAFDSPLVTTASTVTPVHAVRYQPGVQVIPFAPFSDAAVNPRIEAGTSIRLTANDQRVNARVKKISGYRARVSAFALIDIFLVMLSQLYLPDRYFQYRILLLMCPVCGYYGSRSLVPRRLVFYLLFSVAMLIMRIVYFTRALMRSEDSFVIVMQGLVLIYAMCVTKEVTALCACTYSMDRPQALKMLVQINLHSNGHTGFHHPGARIGPELAPEGEVTWSRHTGHHQRHQHQPFDLAADEELGVRQPVFWQQQEQQQEQQQRQSSESISLREALSEGAPPRHHGSSLPPVSIAHAPTAAQVEMADSSTSTDAPSPLPPASSPE